MPSTLHAAGGSPGPSAPARTLFGAASSSASLEAAIHTVVHRLGRHLGFQAFNVVPSTEVGRQSHALGHVLLFHKVIPCFLRCSTPLVQDTMREQAAAVLPASSHVRRSC